jgi:hypothetical protein
VGFGRLVRNFLNHRHEGLPTKFGCRYIEYSVSYDYLTLEIMRRQRVQQKQAKMLEEYRRQFDDFYKGELKF